MYITMLLLLKQPFQNKIHNNNVNLQIKYFQNVEILNKTKKNEFKDKFN